jgi:hypothetical protein
MSDVDAIFAEHRDMAASTVAAAQSYIAAAFSAFGSVYPLYLPLEGPDGDLKPYDSDTPFGPDIDIDDPTIPPRNNLPPDAKVIEYNPHIPNFSKSGPSFTVTAPFVQTPTAPYGTAPVLTQKAPAMPTAPIFPDVPSTYPLPPFVLPYPVVTIPDAPVLDIPVFSGVEPTPISKPSLQEYLDLLRETYDTYAEDVFQRIKSHWKEWMLAMLADQPLIGELRSRITSYLATGGAGVPVPIEDAIVERARGRLQGEYTRAADEVWGSMAQRGLFLPSGALMAGLREARQKSAEAVGAVVTDVAIKNIDIEHKHMQFMLNLAKELETEIMKTSVNVGQLVTTINGQAIDLTKLVLTGMVEINNLIVKIYQAEWDGYKANADVYRTRIEACKLLVDIYEAEIKAELAKTEVNKAHVDVLQSVVAANNSIVAMYKAQIDAETAKIEYSRVQAQIFGEIVRAYVAEVEGWKAEWQAYTSKVEGELAKVKVYTAQVESFTARVQAFKADADAYAAQVQGIAAEADAIAKTNKATLDAWTAEVEGLLKIDTTNVEVYKAQWQAAVEQVKTNVEYWKAQNEVQQRNRDREANLMIEERREALSDWQQRMQALLQAAQGMSGASQVAAQLAGSTMSGITSFAGKLVEEGGL